MIGRGTFTDTATMEGEPAGSSDIISSSLFADEVVDWEIVVI